MRSFDVKRAVRPIIMVALIVVAVFSFWGLWNYYNAEPWTRDGRVRGDIIEVSSDVSGLVTKVLVQDNQTIRKGQVLFEVDTARQVLDVAQAKSDFAKAQSGLAQAESSLVQAKANAMSSSIHAKLADQNAMRYLQLGRGAVSKQELDQVLAVKAQAHAEHAQLEAAIEQVKANIQQQHALIAVAQSHLNLAELNLQRSNVIAPADGTLSNFSLRVGSYVKTGQAVAAMLNRDQLYVVGYFEETKLDKIHIGDPARIELMGSKSIIKGRVQGVASGIEDRERSASSSLLANVNPTFTWVRLAQRIPVKIILDEAPQNRINFVAGRTATVRILPKNE